MGSLLRIEKKRKDIIQFLRNRKIKKLLDVEKKIKYPVKGYQLDGWLRKGRKDDIWVKTCYSYIASNI
jgi:hypothetical protein